MNFNKAWQFHSHHSSGAVVTRERVHDELWDASSPSLKDQGRFSCLPLPPKMKAFHAIITSPYGHWLVSALDELNYHPKQNLHDRSSEDFYAASLCKTPSYIYKNVLIASEQTALKWALHNEADFFWISICVLKSSLLGLVCVLNIRDCHERYSGK